MCDAKSINKEKLGSFVIERLNTSIFTPQHVKELVKLTNEEISTLLELANRLDHANRVTVKLAGELMKKNVSV